MPATATWTITQIERSAANNTITAFHLRVDGQDGNARAKTGLRVEAPPGFTHAPWETLTEQACIGLAHALMDPDQITTMENEVKTKATEKANPVTVYGMPWDPPAPEEPVPEDPPGP